jgi:hypothetical protein
MLCGCACACAWVCLCVGGWGCNSPNTKKISIKEGILVRNKPTNSHLSQYNKNIPFKCQASAAAKSTVQFNYVLQNIFLFE